MKGLRQPGDGGRVADDDRASNPVAADDQLLVNAAPDFRIAHDLVVVLDRFLQPHHGEIDARDLQLRRHPRSGVARLQVPAGQPFGENPCLFPRGGDEALHPAAMLRAVADRVHVVGAGTREVIVDDDPATDRQAGPAREVGGGTNAGGDHDEVAVEHAAVAEGHPGHAIAVGANGRRRQRRRHADAEPGQLQPQHLGARLVELRLHQVRCEMDDVHVDAVIEQSTRGFEAEQPPADHDGSPAVPGLFQDPGAIIQAPEYERVLDAVDRRQKRPAPRCEHEDVVRLNAAVGRAHGSAVGVDGIDGDAGVQRDAVLGVPGGRIGDDIGRLVMAREDAREQDPVVGPVRLVAVDRDLEQVTAAPADEFLDKAGAAHAVADDHQPALTHRPFGTPRRRP